MRPILLGAAHIDRIGLAASDAAGTSAPGRVVQRFGGVAGNVARDLAALGAPPLLASLVGSDADGRAVISDLGERGVDTAFVFEHSSRPTATYHAIIDRGGSLLGGVADMGVYEDLTPVLLEPLRARIEAADLVFVDANLPTETLSWIAGLNRRGTLLADSVSRAKAVRLAPIVDRLDLIFANLGEGAALAGAPPAVDARLVAQALCAAGAGAALVSNGGSPSGFCRGDAEAVGVPVFAANPVDETGAGDALVAGTVFGLIKGHDLVRAIRAGLAAARMCVETEGPDLPGSRIAEIETELQQEGQGLGQDRDEGEGHR